MNKSKIMGIGIGRAGNVLLNCFLHKDKRISGLFVNSSAGDLEDIDLINMEKNAFLFPMINGSGRDRNYAKTFLKDEVQSLADTIAKYPLQTDIFVFFSLDGGTGSGITPTFLQILRRTCPNKTINVIGVLPDYDKADKISLENTINCWNEINEIANKTHTFISNGQTHTVDMINNIMFIDNSKRSSYAEVNEKAINDIYRALCMNGKCEDGSIDDSDARRTFTNSGYGVILTLDDKIQNIDLAIETAKKNTVFATPHDFVCNYLAISTKDYYPTNLVDRFEFEETRYVASNKEHNTIVLGGCNEPTYCIESLKMIYDSIMNKEDRRKSIKRTKIEINTNKTSPTAIVSDVKTSFTATELDTLFDDLF